MKTFVVLPEPKEVAAFGFQFWCLASVKIIRWLRGWGGVSVFADFAYSWMSLVPNPHKWGWEVGVCTQHFYTDVFKRKWCTEGGKNFQALRRICAQTSLFCFGFGKMWELFVLLKCQNWHRIGTETETKHRLVHQLMPNPSCGCIRKEQSRTLVAWQS